MRDSYTEQAKIFLEGKCEGHPTKERPRKEWQEEVKEQRKVENAGKMKKMRRRYESMETILNCQTSK